MGLFDSFAKGGSSKKQSSYGSFSGNTNRSSLPPLDTYQCQYCGKITKSRGTSSLDGFCPGRGKDARGFSQKHIWRKI